MSEESELSNLPKVLCLDLHQIFELQKKTASHFPSSKYPLFYREEEWDSINGLRLDTNAYMQTFLDNRLLFIIDEYTSRIYSDSNSSTVDSLEYKHTYLTCSFDSGVYHISILSTRYGTDSVQYGLELSYNGENATFYLNEGADKNSSFILKEIDDTDTKSTLLKAVYDRTQRFLKYYQKERSWEIGSNPDNPKTFLIGTSIFSKS